MWVAGLIAVSSEVSPSTFMARRSHLPQIANSPVFSFGICFLDYLFIYYYIWLLHLRVLLANWFSESSLVGIFFQAMFFHVCIFFLSGRTE